MVPALVVLTARISGRAYDVQLTSGHVERLRRSPKWIPMTTREYASGGAMVRARREPMIRWVESEALRFTLEFDQAPTTQQIVDGAAAAISRRETALRHRAGGSLDNPGWEMDPLF